MNVLDPTRAAFGPAPRTIKTWDHLEPPRWMKGDDPLRATYTGLRDLLTKGDVVWGRIVQANTLLFRPGGEDCPADVLFGADPGVDLAPRRLDAAADAAFALKGKTPEDEGLARVARALTNEMERHGPVDLPDAVTHGARMRMVTIMVHRGQLPCGWLASTVLPLLVTPDRDFGMILPKRYWAGDLVRGWLDLGAAARTSVTRTAAPRAG
jgi:hypothetical protein